MPRKTPQFTPRELAEVADFLFVHLSDHSTDGAALETITPDDLDSAGAMTIIPYEVVTFLQKVKQSGVWQPYYGPSDSDTEDDAGEAWKRA